MVVRGEAISASSESAIRRSDGMEIAGVWNLDRVNLTLGGVLAFTEELASLSSLNNGSRTSLWFTGNLARLGQQHTEVGTSGLREFRLREASPVLSTLLSLESVDSCSYARSPALVLPRLSRDHLVWSAGDGGNSTASTGSLNFLQDFYRKHGRLPRAQFKPAVHVQVIRWIKRTLGDRYPVTVHLKKTSSRRTESNAHWPAWQGLFESVKAKSRVAFILIGADPIPDSIASLSNVIVAERERLDLRQQLALVGCSHFFMGMSSGPCNAAIMSDVPYAIYKHPSHHRRAMLSEIGVADRFTFANDQQRMLRRLDAPALLASEFRRMDTVANRRHWQTRMDEWSAQV